MAEIRVTKRVGRVQGHGPKVIDRNFSYSDFGSLFWAPENDWWQEAFFRALWLLK